MEGPNQADEMGKISGTRGGSQNHQMKKIQDSNGWAGPKGGDQDQGVRAVEGRLVARLALNEEMEDR